MNKNNDALTALSELTPREVYAKTSSDAYTSEYDFTEKEMKAIDRLSKSIDVLDTASLIGYGADAQTELAKFSDKKLASRNTSTLTVAGDDLTKLVTTLKMNKGNTEPKNPIARLFRNAKKELAEAQAQYSSVLANVQDSEKILRERHLATLTSGVKDFDEMYDLNLDYYKTLTMYIYAGKQRIQELKTIELPRMIQKAHESGSQLDAQASNDLAEAINSFEAKLYALQISRQLVIQQACQIRQLQKTYRDLAEQIINIIYNAIPSWKNHLQLSLGISDVKDATVAINASIEFTESMLLANATELAKASIEAAKVSNRPVASLEVVQKTNDILIDSVEQIININIERMSEIREGEKILVEIDEKRKSSLLDFSKRIQESTIQSALTTSQSPQHKISGSTSSGAIETSSPTLSSILREQEREEKEPVIVESEPGYTPTLKL